MRPAPGPRPLALFALLAAAACGRCGAPPARDAAELLPAKFASAATSAPLGMIAQRAQALIGLAAQIPGGEQLGDYAHAWSAQLGLELTSREGLSAAGLDPERGLGLALLEPPPGSAHPPWLLALPLVSPERFAQHVESLLTARVGYPQRGEEVRGQVHCVTFAREGVPERIAYAVVRGYGVVARGVDPATLIAEVAARTPEQSLLRDGRLARAKGELGAPELLVLSSSANPLVASLLRRVAPSGGPLDRLLASGAVAGDSSVGLSLLADGAELRLSQELPEPLRGELRALLSASPGAGPRAPQAVGPDADAPFKLPRGALVLRTNLLGAQLPAWLSRLPLLREALSRLKLALGQQGVDLERDLLGALSPGAGLSLELAPQANLGRSLDPAALDLADHSPFDVVRLAAAASARDPERVRRALAALALALPAFGAQAQRTAEGKRIAGGTLDEWSTRYPGGEGIRFGLLVPGRDLCAPGGPARTQALVFALGGEGSLEELLGAQRPCAAPPTGPPASGEATPAALSLQLELGLLAEQIHHLPDAAYGTGPQVFVARSLVSQVIEPLSRLRAQAELRPGERGLLGTLRVRVAEAAPPATSPPASP